MLNNLDTHFFFKNRASSLFYIWNRLTSCKKAKKSYGGKYENFASRTDGQTRGAGYVGPAEGKGGSEKGLHSRRQEYDI